MAPNTQVKPRRPNSEEAPRPVMASMPPVATVGNPTVSRANLDLRSRRKEERMQKAGLGLDGIMGISKGFKDGRVSSVPQETARFMVGGLRNHVLESAGVLVEQGAPREGGALGQQHRAAIYVHSQQERMAAMKDALGVISEEVRKFARNAQKHGSFRAHSDLVANGFAPLLELGYRTVAAALLEAGATGAATASLDRFTADPSERQTFMARLMAFQRDAMVVVPSGAQRRASSFEPPQVVGFLVRDGENGTPFPVGINLRDPEGPKAITGASLVRDVQNGSIDQVIHKEIPLAEFFAKFGVTWTPEKGDARFLSQKTIEDLRGANVIPVTVPARDADLLPSGMLSGKVAAEFTVQGILRQSEEIRSMIRLFEDVIRISIDADIAEFEKNGMLERVVRERCEENGWKPTEDSLQRAKDEIVNQFNLNARGKLEVDYGIGGLRVLAAFAEYVGYRKSFPERVGENVYRHGFPKKLSAFLVKNGWEAGGRVEDGGRITKPDVRFQALDRLLNQAGQAHRDKYRDLDVIEREIAVQSDAIRAIRATLQSKEYGGFSEEALDEVLGEDAIAVYASSYRDQVGTLKDLDEKYRKDRGTAMADAFAGVMMARSRAIPGLIESDPESDAGLADREERMVLVRQRLEVALGARKDPFAGERKTKTPEAEKVDREIRSFLAVDRDGNFRDPYLRLAIERPAEIGEQTPRMQMALDTFREVAILVDTMDDAMVTYHLEAENANRLLRNGYPRDSQDDLMRPTSGQTTVSVPTVMNPTRPMEVVAKDSSGGYLVFPVEPGLDGTFVIGSAERITRLDLPARVDRATQNDIRMEIFAWAARSSEMTAQNILGGISGLALDQKGRRKLFRVNVEPGGILDKLGVMPAGTYLPVIGNGKDAPGVWSRSYLDEGGRWKTENFTRPHLPLPTTDLGQDRMRFFALPTAPGEVDGCLQAVTDFLDGRAEERLGGDADRENYEAFKRDLSASLKRSFTAFAKGARNAAWMAPAFGATGGVNAPSILGIQFYSLPETALYENERKTTFRPIGVREVNGVMQRLGMHGCLVSAMVVEAGATGSAQ